MSARFVVISGRVQGVGFRQWMRWQAQALGVSGWVRNTHSGTVEAMLDGDSGEGFALDPLGPAAPDPDSLSRGTMRPRLPHLAGTLAGGVTKRR
jgi:hypothetical protein